MRGYIAFVKKEFTENMKNYRFLILFAVFLTFGIMSTFLAKFTPEILLALAAVLLWIVGFLYLSILMIGCVIFKQTFTSILFTGGIAALISLLGMIEPIAKFNPFILTSKNVDLISDEVILAEFIISVFISVILSILGLLIAIGLFNKKPL
ncbi:hypothetical protein D7X25_26510 [bacterium 1XD42-8]|nr:hypothetical protein D7X25_26510 [bacterium 1XD42-8]